MKKIILCMLLPFGLVKPLAAQTTVTIIGTAHEKTSHFNVDSLLNMLNKVKPDVILQELDTALMDEQGNYKGRAINDMGNEHLASMRYKQTNNRVIFRQFDIAGRSYYYASHNTFAMENELSNALDNALQNNLLSAKDKQLILSFYKINQELNALYESDIKGLNSKLYMATARTRQDMLYNKELQVLANTPQLKEYYDFQKDDGNFWTTRNQTMIGNIANYATQFKGKKIVVLTGAMHRYFLVDGLTPLQNKLHFKLQDLPD